MPRLLPKIMAAVAAASFALAGPALASPCGQLDALFSRWSGADTPGFAVAVVASGQIRCEQAYGQADLTLGQPITPTTRFNLASLTKPFVALAAVDVSEGGGLDLDAPLSQVLPDAAPYYRSVTTRQLLSHTAGVPDLATLIVLAGRSSADPLTNGAFRDLVDRQQHLNFEPGDRYLYSNSGYLLTVAALEKATGRSYRDLMAERVFGPAGMESPELYLTPGQAIGGAALSYGFDPGAKAWRPVEYASAAQGSTNLYASAGDVARWAIHFLRSAAARDGRIAAMTRPTTLNSGAVAPYGLGLEIIQYRGRTLWMHTGSEAGYRSVLLMFPEIDAAVVVLGNASVRPQRLAESVADAMFADDFPLPSPHLTSPPALPVDAARAVAFSGYYELEPGRVAQIAFAENQVYVAVDPIGVAAFDLVAENQLLHRPSGVALSFEEPGANGFGSVQLSGIGAPSVGRRVAVDKAEPAALSARAGRYASVALEATYEVVAGQNGLSLLLPGQADPLPLTLLKSGRYVSAEVGATVEFVDDKTFLLSTWRVNNVRFMRVPRQAQ